MESISTGSHKAKLTLADGSEYDLSQFKQDIKISEDVLITNKNNTLRFEKKDSTSGNDKLVQYNTIAVPRFGEYSITLADGTKVWLNAMSSLKFPDKFSGNERQVLVEGEAFFDVAKNKDKPFIVNCNNTRIKVLGTEFNIRAYADDKAIATTLVEGSVQMSINDRPDATVILKPGDQGRLEDAENNITVEKVDVSSVVAWKMGEFVFKNKTLGYIMDELSRWYDINVVYDDLELKNEKFYVFLDRSDDFKTVLKKFVETENINIRVKGNNVIISKRK